MFGEYDQLSRLMAQDLRNLYMGQQTSNQFPAASNIYPGQIYSVGHSQWNGVFGGVGQGAPAVQQPSPHPSEGCSGDHEDGHQVLGPWIKSSSPIAMSKGPFFFVWVPITDDGLALARGDGWRLATSWVCKCGKWEVDWQESPLVLLAHLALLSPREVAVDGGDEARLERCQIADGDSV